MFRRLRLIPFTVTIPEDKRDPYLADKLLAERDGILVWAVEGCLAWQRDGLKPLFTPKNDARRRFNTIDNQGEWVSECGALILYTRKQRSK